MANKKIGDLTAGTPQAADELPAQRGPSNNVKLTVQGLVDAAQVYVNPDYPALTTTQAALDQLLYSALTVPTFTNDVGTVEIGATVNVVNLAWTYNKPAVVSQSMAPTPGSMLIALRALALSGLGLVADTTFTLTGNDGVQNAVKTTQVLFRNKTFWGPSVVVTPPNGAFIDTLGASAFATSRNQTRTFNCSAQYIYFAWPSTFGTPTFKVNGFPVSGWVKTTVSYTNAQGFTSSYDCYRSQFLQNGAAITVEVT